MKKYIKRNFNKKKRKTIKLSGGEDDNDILPRIVYKPISYAELRDSIIQLQSIYENNDSNYWNIWPKGKLEDWDVSNITDMSRLFSNFTTFNEPINSWDVSNVTNMEGMFKWCIKFNQPLDNWNVNNVTHMDNMFYRCKKFNQPLHNWNIRNVITMSYMFVGCENFNQPSIINSWNLRNTNNANINGMFIGTPMENVLIVPTVPPRGVSLQNIEDVNKISNDSLINFDEEKRNCSICNETVDDDAVQTQKCKNIFHNKCLSQWCVNKSNCPCPMCRKSLVFKSSTISGGRKRKSVKKIIRRNGKKTIKTIK